MPASFASFREVVIHVAFDRTIGDRVGEAKAHGNIGNTLKVLGVFDDAMTHCQQHLSLATQLGDKVSMYFCLSLIRMQNFIVHPASILLLFTNNFVLEILFAHFKYFLLTLNS